MKKQKLQKVKTTEIDLTLPTSLLDKIKHTAQSIDVDYKDYIKFLLSKRFM